MLCQCRPLARRLAVHILRESRAILGLINQATSAVTASTKSREDLTSAAAILAFPMPTTGSLCCLDLLDSLAPSILDRILPLLPQQERVSSRLLEAFACCMRTPVLSSCGLSST